MIRLLLALAAVTWLLVKTGHYGPAVGTGAALLFLLSTVNQWSMPTRHRPRLGVDRAMPRAKVVQHERGHVRMLAHLGLGSRMSVYRQGDHWAGHTIPHSWSKFDALPAADRVAVYVAGEIAAGTKSGCEGDQAAVRYVARSHRDVTAGYALARRVVG